MPKHYRTNCDKNDSAIAACVYPRPRGTEAQCIHPSETSGSEEDLFSGKRCKITCADAELAFWPQRALRQTIVTFSDLES